MRFIVMLLALSVAGAGLDDVLAQPHPFGVPEAGGGAMRAPGWLGDIFAQVAMWQSHFYRQLTGAVRAWQADGGGWLLVGLSFAYGVFHALGPGHGKAVISAYVLANRQTARNGALLSMASAMVQAAVAVLVVVVLAWLLNATAAVMDNTTRWLETASYALVAALGVWLVWNKALRPLWRGGLAHVHDHAAASGGDHAHHECHAHEAGGHARHAHHAHGLDCGCGHAHAPLPDQVAGALDWRRAIGAILAVGLRPCSGALIVLVFALSQGFFLAGVASALAMGVGTGLTVAALVGLAVLAREGATWLGGTLSSAWAARLRYVIEALAACAVLLLGGLLLGGQLASG